MLQFPSTLPFGRTWKKRKPKSSPVTKDVVAHIIEEQISFYNFVLLYLYSVSNTIWH